MILHADGNSFYASCEQIYRPDLRNKPIIVLSNNDGIIIALSKEAKDIGLKRGDPFFKVTDICEENKVSVFSSNYTLYADISKRITSIYMEYAPQIEEYSIDESFLFFDDCNWTKENYEEIGRELKSRIWKEVGIPICVGGAPTKTLAKLYNKKAKSHNGVFIYDSSTVDQLLEETECATIWGIGPAKANTLAENGIYNALQLKHMEISKAKKLLTVNGLATVRELNGFRCIDRIERSKKDIITTSRQFSKRVYDLPTLETAVVKYTELAVEKLRKQKSETSGVLLSISTCNYYNKDESQQYSNSVLALLPRETSYTPDIVFSATQALKKIYRKGYGYKTLLINLINLTPAALQGNLWIDPKEDIKKRDLMKTVDLISENYGRGTIHLAKGNAAGTIWEMKRSKLSPCYTTRLSDLPRVK